MVNKIKLAHNLKYLLKQKNISESELARVTGIGQPVIHRMAKGETYNPKIETLRPIARFFAISIDQLIGDAPFLNAEDTPILLAKVPIFNLKEVITWVADSSFKPTSFIFTDAEITKYSFAIKLQETTFSPLFPKGTEIIFDRNKLYSHKDFVLVHTIHHSQATLKQLLLDGEDIYLKPLNPNLQTTPLRQETKIIGTMIQAKIDFLD